MVRQVKKEIVAQREQQIQKRVEIPQSPDKVFPVSKLQVRAGRKIELWLGDLMRTMFRAITITLNTKTSSSSSSMQFGASSEKERRYIPQPCPKIWKKRGGNKTNTNGTAKSHLAVLKETKRGLALNQVNIGILGQLLNPTTGERCFYGNYSLIIRLEGNECPSIVLPFELSVVTSHNHGNNTTQIDVARICGFPSDEDEEDDDEEEENNSSNESESEKENFEPPCYEIVWPESLATTTITSTPVKQETVVTDEYAFYPNNAEFEIYRVQRLAEISLHSINSVEEEEETAIIETPPLSSPVFDHNEPAMEYTFCWDQTFNDSGSDFANVSLYDSCVL